MTVQEENSTFKSVSQSVSQSNVTCIFSILLTSKADVCAFILHGINFVSTNCRNVKFETGDEIRELRRRLALAYAAIIRICAELASAVVVYA